MLRLLLLQALIALPACARIADIHIDHDARPNILLSRPFGFNVGGHLTFNVSDVHIHGKSVKDADLSDFGFYVAQNVGDELAEDPSFTQTSPEQRCSFVSPSTPSVLTFQDSSISGKLNNRHNSEQVSHEVGEEFLTVRSGQDVLFFANCDPQAAVSFSIHIEMYNYDRWGHKSYLSMGELELPSLYLVMLGLFTSGLVLWCQNLYVYRAAAHRIHYLMTVLGAAKVLTLMAQCGMYHFLRVTGHPKGWNVAYYIFTLTRGVFLFTVIALIGAGWSYMTPHLGDNNKKILMAVIPMQVLAQIAVIIVDDFTPAKRSWFAWRSVMHFVDIACCAAILFPIVWRIAHMRGAAKSDHSADLACVEQSVKQRAMFKHFCIAVLCYICLTRIVVFILHAALPFPYVWVAYAVEEAATLAFYVLTATQFRPRKGQGCVELPEFYELLESDVELGQL